MASTRVACQALIDAGMGAIRERLEVMGFVYHPHLYALPLTPPLYGGVLFGRAVHRGDGSMGVTCSVFVMHEQAERLLTAISGFPYHRYQGPGTAQVGLGSLLYERGDISSRYFEVAFLPDKSVELSADDLCEPIHALGIQWIHAHASLEQIDRVIHDVLNAGGAVFRRKIPLVDWMVGKPEAAREYMASYLSSLGMDRWPGASTQKSLYSWYVGQLEALMATGPWQPTPEAQRTYLRIIEEFQRMHPKPEAQPKSQLNAPPHWTTPEETPNATMVVSREQIAADLHSYGEEEMAQRILTVDDHMLRRIGTRALQLMFMPEDGTPGGKTPSDSKACALAAVELLEGAARPLRFKRRKLR